MENHVDSEPSDVAAREGEATLHGIVIIVI